MGVKTQIQCKGGHKTVVLNRRRAIRERCLNCSAWSYSQVDICPHEKSCPLYPFRTGQGKQVAKARAKAIRSYCSWCMATEQPSRCVVIDCPFTAIVNRRLSVLNYPYTHELEGMHL